MANDPVLGYDIREALPAEYARLGRLTVDAYASLTGMPTIDEQAGCQGRASRLQLERPQRS